MTQYPTDEMIEAGRNAAFECAQPVSRHTAEAIIEAAMRAKEQSYSPTEATGDDVATLKGLSAEFTRWLEKGPDEQPHYGSGIRAFSTGDLKHFVASLNTAIATLSPNGVSQSAVERLRGAFIKIFDRYPMIRVPDEVKADLARAAIATLSPNGVTIDLEKSFWRSLEEAAAQSSWIPKEHYFVNDWVNDCCEYLRHGNGVSQSAVERAREICAGAFEEKANALESADLPNMAAVRIVREQAENFRQGKNDDSEQMRIARAAIATQPCQHVFVDKGSVGCPHFECSICGADADDVTQPDTGLREALKQAALDLHEAAGNFAHISKLDAKGCSEVTREKARRAEAALARTTFETTSDEGGSKL